MVLAAADVELQSFRKLSGSIRVKYASTATITISSGLNAGDTIDTGTRLDWLSSRETSATTAYDRFPGLLINVTGGSVNKNSIWECVSAPGGTLDTTSLRFYRVNSDYHVAMFGAIGDGTTDDSAAFNAALVVLDANGGVLNLGNGKTYLFSSQVTWDRLTSGGTTFARIDGHGSYLKTSGSISALRVNGHSHGGGNTYINDLWIDQNDNATAINGFEFFAARYITLANCGVTAGSGSITPVSTYAQCLFANSDPADSGTGSFYNIVDNCTFGGGYAHPPSAGVRLRGDCNGTHVVNSKFTGPVIGIELVNEAGYNDYSDNIKIDQCSFEGVTHGVKLHAETGQGYHNDCVISNCRVESVTNFVWLDADTAPTSPHCLHMHGNSVPGSGAVFLKNDNALLVYNDFWPTTAVDNSLVRYDATVTSRNGQTSAAIISDTGALSTPKLGTKIFTSLADDTASSMAGNVGSSSRGIVLVNGQVSSQAGIAFVRVGSGAETSILAGGADFAVTTGVLAGTTGTDTKITISAHTDNLIYIENRTGGTVTFAVTYIGM